MSRARLVGLAAVAAAALGAAACSNGDYLVVTVSAHANVHGAAALRVTQHAGGEARTDELQLGAHTFPATFSLVAPASGAALDLQLEADDGKGAPVALGEVTVPPGAGSASVALVGTDFVVNTDYAMDQFLSNDFEANGMQLAATPDGNWTVGFRDNCGGTGKCSVYARRFDSAGQPVATMIAAGTNQFPVTINQSDGRVTPAVATAGTTTLVLWDYGDIVGGGQGIACRAIDEMGNPSSGQLPIASEDADVVAASPLSDGNVVVSWQVGVIPPDATIHTLVVKPDCSTTPATPLSISVLEGTSDGPNRSDVASNGDAVLYAWIVDGGVRVRPSDNQLNPKAESSLVTPSGLLDVQAVRVAPLGTGFAVIARWITDDPSDPNDAGPGKMELYRVDASGAMIGGPTLITDQSLSDFNSGEQSFGVATRSDGALLVVWHVCDMPDNLASCSVHGRLFRPTGVPVGDAFTIPTTKTPGQYAPSAVALDGAFAVAWNDLSMEPPDTQGSAVRARIIYPPYDDATSVLGAACGGSLPACGPGLVCAMGSDGAQRCYEGCTPGGPPPLCPHGGTCDETSSACVF